MYQEAEYDIKQCYLTSIVEALLRLSPRPTDQQQSLINLDSNVS